MSTDDQKKYVTIFQCFPTKGRCKPEDHDFETDGLGQVSMSSACTKCGMLFGAYIHLEAP